MPQATSAHPLDRLIGAGLPRLASPADVAALEREAPWPDRVAVHSTFEALQRGAALNPDGPALRFLANADASEAPQVLSHAGLMARITQAANLFHELGIGRGDVVSFLLPLLPQAFVTLWGAQAVGVANPVNPMLSSSQLADILRAAGTRVLVALGPQPGSDIWDKVSALRDRVPGLRRVLMVGGAAHAEWAGDDLDRLLDAQPADRLLSGRLPAAGDIAGYFHTGGTTGTPKLVRHTHANQVYQAWGLGLLGLCGPGSTVLFGLPLFHVGGALTQALSWLANGGGLVVLSGVGWRHPNALRQVWRLVERYRPTVFSSVPTVLAGHLDGNGYAGANFKEVLYLVNVDKQPQTLTLGALKGKSFVLHPVHGAAGAADKRAASAAYTAATGAFTVPARTAVVFVVN